MAMLQRTAFFIGRVLRALVALMLVAGALAIGLALAIGVVLRLAWLRRRGASAKPTVARRRQGAAGEVIDVEVREVRVREVGAR